MLVRWRAELLLAGAVSALWYFAGGVAVGIAAAVTGVLVGFVPPVRAITRDALQAVICMHRVRAGLVQAGVADRSGRLPWITAATSRNELVLVGVWLRSGTTVDDLRNATDVVATACGAARVEIHQRSPRQDRAVVAVFRPRWGWWTR